MSIAAITVPATFGVGFEESWTRQTALRFLRSSEDPTSSGRLQQMWTSNKGAIEWWDVPVVIVQS